MRSESEMMDLSLTSARNDERIRIVGMEELIIHKKPHKILRLIILPFQYVIF